MPVTINDPKREDPLVGFNFMLDMGGTVKGYFTEVSGIGSESEIVEHKVVSEAGHESVLKTAGRLKWGDIVLKRGITSNMDLWNWRKMVEDGNVDKARKNGSVVMFNRALKEVARWNFSNAWPSKISGPAPKADGNEIVVEEMTIVHEYITRIK